MRDAHLLVVDIGGTRIRMSFVALHTGAFPLPTQEHWTAMLNGPDALSVLKDLLHKYIAKSNISPVGVVIGLPGVVASDNDQVLMCNNIPDLTGRKIATELREVLGCPIYIEHDTKLLLAGELSKLSGYDTEIALGVFFGTGVGADVLMSNPACSIFENGLELGHLPLSLNGERCVCGKIGCAETFISGHKLQEISDAFNIPICSVFTHWDDDSMLALRLKEFVAFQAMILAIAVSIIQPTLLIIGGGIISMEGYPKDVLKKGLNIHLLNHIPRRKLSVVWGQQGDKAGFYGGEYLFRERFEK